MVTFTEIYDTLFFLGATLRLNYTFIFLPGSFHFILYENWFFNNVISVVFVSLRFN